MSISQTLGRLFTDAQDAGAYGRYATRPEDRSPGTRHSLKNERTVQARGFAKTHLNAMIDRGRADRADMRGLRQRLAASVGNQERREGRRLAATASSATAQANVRRPTSFAGAIEDATRIARSRDGIMRRGDAAIENQALKDRIAFVQRGVRRRGALQRGLTTAMNIQEGVNVGVSDANQRISQSRASMFGGITGALVGSVSSQEGRQNWARLFGRGATTPAPGGG